MRQIALVGKPNSGKSSLFNLLTGLNQKVGNYHGVTVEKKSGQFKKTMIIDLPGLKSLWADNLDEKISVQQILNYGKSKDPILFVANGSQLEDSLMLFSEIADLQIPLAVVINFKDELKRSQLLLDIDKLKLQLGCEVVLMNGKTGEGLEEVRQIIGNDQAKLPHTFRRSQYEKIEGDQFENQYLQMLEADRKNFTHDQFEALDQDFSQRQVLISKIINDVLSENPKRLDLMINSKKWDRVLLHPIWGLLIFLGVMLVVFQSVFSLSSYPMDLIDSLFAWATEMTHRHVKLGWFSDLISEGIIPGLGGVLIFIPQIAILFLLLGILENTGYLSRISYISDNFLQRFGLSGKSVIPLMSSWACAIPAIMSTRMIDDRRERMAVILASPLMTCSARLPVYTILIAVTFPERGSGFFNLQGVTLLALYLIGVIATLVVAWFISRTSTEEKSTIWTLELPLYRVPNWRNVFFNAWTKTKSFVVEAGKIIFFISILLWLLASFSPKDQQFIDARFKEYTEEGNEFQKSIKRESVALEYSYAGYLGKVIEPVIKPLGYDWKIGIALITSFAAREVFVGTLSTIYSIGSEEDASIVQRLRKEKIYETGEPRYNLATSFSLLLFYVFAMQCMSTMAIVRKETGQWKYAIYQFIFMLVLAYLFAFGAYQILS